MPFFIMLLITSVMTADLCAIIKRLQPGWNRRWILTVLLLIFLPGLYVYSPYFVFCLYTFIFVLVMQGIFKLFHRAIGWPVLIGVVLLAGVYTACGLYTFQDKQRVEIALASEKISEPSRLAFISDTHLPLTDPDDVVRDLEKEDIDLLLIGGDLTDEKTSQPELEAFLDKLDTLEVPVVYVFGNHDSKHLSKQDVRAALKKHGAAVLEDEFLDFQGLQILGRIDRSCKTERADLTDLMKEADDSRYTIVVDHQPVDGKKADASGVDLLLSGHTHNGQLYPFGGFFWLFPKYDGAYGFIPHDYTTQYISSGYSGWGFPVRTMGQGEYVILDLQPA